MIRRFRLEALLGLALLTITISIFSRIVVEDFEFFNVDDDQYVYNNPYVLAGLNTTTFAWALTTFHADNWHPLTWLSLQLDQELYKRADARGYHVTNILIHAANVVLLFVLLRIMTARVWPSALVALFFAIHPLRVESVAWVAERKDVLSMFFCLLTVASYIYYARAPAFFRYCLVCLLFGLALASKPMVVTLPFLLLLLDYWPLHRLDSVYGAHVPPYVTKMQIPASKPASFSSLVREKIPLLTIAALCSWLTIYAQEHLEKATYQFPLSIRLQNALISYVTYMAKVIWPEPLVIFYPHPGYNIPLGHWLGAAGVLILASIYIVGQARRRPYLAVGWFWYLGTLVPVIGLVPVGLQGVADRYTYLPTIGLLLMGAWRVADWTSDSAARSRLVAAISALLLLSCLAITWRQLGFWRNSVTLWEHTLQVLGPNRSALQGLAEAFEAHGQIEEASSNFRQAVDLDPSPLSRMVFGLFLERHGKTAEAIEQFKAVLAANPNQAAAHFHLGLALENTARVDDAIPHFTAAIRINPSYGLAHYHLGMAYESGHRLDLAQRELSIAARINPRAAEVRTHLGMVLGSQGRLDEAIDQLSTAVTLDPRNAAAHYNLGIALQMHDRLDEAREHFAVAARLDPRYARLDRPVR